MSGLSTSLINISKCPVIDVTALRRRNGKKAQRIVDEEIFRACRDVGFFLITGHQVSRRLQRELEDVTKAFFDLPLSIKQSVHMSKGKRAWRGYFQVGEELTSGLVDEKEGYYFGSQDDPADARPLHGRNLFPTSTDVGEDLSVRMREVVCSYMEEMTDLGRLLLRSLARGMRLKDGEGTFEKTFGYGDCPTTLFRWFRYPPHDSLRYEKSYAVGEHTDYGYLTILKVDDEDGKDCGGLQIKSDQGRWIDVPKISNAFVVNLGDALEASTGGLLRATPHRVLTRRNARTNRHSWPFFFDPAFDAPMTNLVQYLPADLRREALAQRKSRDLRRWDGADPTSFRGTYGDYLFAKVSKVFPELARRASL